MVKKYWEPEELIERIRPLGFEGAGTKIGAEDGFGFVVWDVVRGYVRGGGVRVRRW